MTVSVSVVMSVCNGATTVREAVESVLAQTWDDFEFIIIDDGSTDTTPEILSSYHDSRLRVIRQQNAGLTISLNRGIAAARAPLVARMDADDVSLPSRLEEQVRVLESCPDIVLVGSDADLIDQQGRVMGSLRHLARDDWIRRVYAVGNQFVHGSVMFRREVFGRAGRYDEGLRYSQDFDLWWRMMRAGEACNLPRTLYALRRSPESISVKLREAQDKDRDRIIRRIWRDVLDVPDEYPPKCDRGTRCLPTGPDPHVSERRRFYARLLMRMGIGLVLHGAVRRGREYFASSVRADPTVKEAWGGLIGCCLFPSLVEKRCRARAKEYPLYRVIQGAGLEGKGKEFLT